MAINGLLAVMLVFLALSVTFYTVIDWAITVYDRGKERETK